MRKGVQNMKVRKMSRILTILLSVSLLLGLMAGMSVFAETEECEDLLYVDDPCEGEGATVIEDDTELYDFEIVDKPVTRDLEVVTGKVFVPAYDGGTSSTWMDYDCGVGMGYRSYKNQSKLRIVTGTTSSGFTAWCTKLVDNGFTYVWHRSCAAQTNTNRYAKYLSEDGSYSIYTYFVPATKMTRIIVDTHEDTLGTFSYVGKGTGNTEVYMYYLSGMDDGWAAASPETAGNRFRSNAGSMFVIKMADNSLFIIDGGGYNQMGDRACEELYTFLRSITGVPEGRRMTINTWFISHLHTDHCGGFPRFLQKFYTEFELCNVMYNFDIEGQSRGFIQRVSKIYPDAKYYKPHTGESFKVVGVQFDILYSVEDRYKPNSSNQLILNDTSCTDHTNENNTSIVMRMTFDGKTMLLTGDIRDADAVLMSMYPAADLHADILQFPHHNFDDHATLAQTVDPSIIFINQVKSSNFNRSRLYSNRNGWRNVADAVYFGGNETVGYRADKGIFYRKASDGYDYLGWAAGAYPIWEENPVTVKNAVQDPENYYRYTRTTGLTSTEKAYLIVDDKLGTVLSYDAISGEITSSKTGLTVGDNFYFADSQRRMVNWLIKYGATGANASALYADATHYTSATIRKGTSDYWGTPTKNSGVTLGNGDTFTSTGFFSSRSPFSAQVEATSKQNWIDLLSNGTCLIYRYVSGTCYPLFRDGDATGEGGWGTAKLSASTGASRAAILLNRLYAYESTASTMTVSWSGHEDYYTYTGASQDSVDTLLAADLRIKYTMDAFGENGEMPHTFGEEHRPNTYYLEYSPAYDNKTAQDYMVTIKYTSANGTAVTIGTTTLHVQSRPDTNKLYIDFDDDDIDREKYSNQLQYGGLSFDSSSRWTVTRTNTTTKEDVPVTTSVDRNDGTLKLSFKDLATDKKSTVLTLNAAGEIPLNYSPGKAKVMQIRFKMNNLKAAPDLIPYFRLWYTNTTEGTVEWKYEKIQSLGKNFVSDGEYITATIEFYTQEEINAGGSGSGFPTTTFAKSGKVKGIRLGFYNLQTDIKDKAGEIEIDYLYIGPKNEAPYHDHMGVDGIGKAPTCTEAGYTPGTTCSICGQVMIEQEVIPAIGHSYTYTKVDDQTHIVGCANCDLSDTVSHNYVDGTCTCGEVEIKEPVVDEAIVIGHTLNLASDISVNFVVKTSLLKDYVNHWLLVEIPTYSGNTRTGTRTVTIEPVLNGNYYYYTLTGLTAVHMGDVVSAQLYMEKDGQEYSSKVDTYSIAQYAYSQMNKDGVTEKLKALCADLLRYGAEAQIYKNYRTDALVDESMTDAHKEYLTDIEAIEFGNVNEILNDLNDPTITWAGKSLNLDSKISVKYIFDLGSYTGSVDSLTLIAHYVNRKGEAVDTVISCAELYHANQNRYAFTFDGLLAAELRCITEVAIYEGDTRLSQTLRYSPDAYGNNKTGQLLILCKALFAYSDTAKAYFS